MDILFLLKRRLNFLPFLLTHNFCFFRRSVCVKQALNTRRWLVNALVTWHVSFKITTTIFLCQNWCQISVRIFCVLPGTKNLQWGGIDCNIVISTGDDVTFSWVRVSLAHRTHFLFHNAKIEKFYLPSLKENKKQIVKQICGLLDSEFVKTCHEPVTNHGNFVLSTQYGQSQSE